MLTISLNSLLVDVENGMLGPELTEIQKPDEFYSFGHLELEFIQFYSVEFHAHKSTPQNLNRHFVIVLQLR